MSGYSLCRRCPLQHIVMLAILERLPVNDLDDTGSGESDQAALFEFAQRSAYGLNRDRQIVAAIRGHDRRDEPRKDRIAMNAKPPPRSRLQGDGRAVGLVEVGQNVEGAFLVRPADLG